MRLLTRVFGLPIFLSGIGIAFGNRPTGWIVFNVVFLLSLKPFRSHFASAVTRSVALPLA